jgi:hypothetical protein
MFKREGKYVTKKSVHITLNQRYPFRITEFPVDFQNNVGKFSPDLLHFHSFKFHNEHLPPTITFVHLNSDLYKRNEIITASCSELSPAPETSYCFPHYAKEENSDLLYIREELLPAVVFLLLHILPYSLQVHRPFNHLEKHSNFCS